MNTTSHELQAAIICRVSTREQEDGYSLEAQQQLLEDYCQRKGYTVVFIRSFSETASKYDQRKKFKEFIQEVRKKKVCHIIAEKVDRVSRSGSRDSVMVDEWLEEDETRHIQLVKQSLDIHKYAPSTQKFVWNMHVAVAKHTSDNLSEEVRKAQDTMIKKGIWPTAALPGYYRDTEHHPECPVRPSDTSNLVVQMFEHYDSGEYSVERLAEKVFEMGLRSNQGNKLPPSRIHKLLQNPFYIGRMLWNGKVHDAIHQPLIKHALYQRVQNRLTRKHAYTYQMHSHLLRGLVNCHNCNHPITWEAKHGYVYGYCRNKHCTDQWKVKQDVVEHMLIQKLAALQLNNERLIDWMRRALKATQDQHISYREDTIQTIESQLRTVRQRRDNLLNMSLDGQIDRETFNTKNKLLRDEEDILAEQLTALGESEEVKEDMFFAFYDMSQHAAKLYLQEYPDDKEAKAVERREMIKKVFFSISTSFDKPEVKYKKAFELLAEAVAQTNNDSNIKKMMRKVEKDFDNGIIGSEITKEDAQMLVHPLWLPG